MNHPQNQLNEALRLHQSGKINEALSIYEVLQLSYPDNGILHYLAGTALYQKGQLDASLPRLLKAVSLAPEHFGAWNNLGVLYKARKQYQDSLSAFDKCLAIKANYADAHNNRGLVFNEIGKLNEALVCFDRALSINPDYADAHNNRANVLQDLGDLMGAVAAYNQALAIKPDSTESLNNRGNARKALGQFDEAITDYERALSLNPMYAEALNNKGNALKDMGLLEDALACYEQSIVLKPNYAESFYNRGLVLKELDRLDESLQSYDLALAIRPDYAEAHNNRGNVFKDKAQFLDALAAYECALKYRKDYAEAFYNRGIALHALNQLDDALHSYQRAIEIKPDYADAFINQGNVFKALNRVDECISAYDAALDLKPGHPDAEWNKSLVLILTQRYAEGWQLFESRLKKPDMKADYSQFPKLNWRGKESVQGLKVLIQAEQGFGDSIQFCRYLPMLHRLGAKVIFEVPAPLLPLVSTIGCPLTVVAKGQALPDFDAYCPLMSLPYVFETTIETIPSQMPYLSVEPNRAAAWRRRLGPKNRLRVGLVWSGNEKHKNDINRSMRLSQLSDLLNLPFEWHALQKEYRDADESILNQRPEIHRHQTQLNDFADTAALVDCMDLVISVDTSVAHVAGALGKPLWVLLPFAPDYRWMLDRDDSPWYPTARLFRQNRIGCWAGVVQEITSLLKKMI